MTESDAWVLYRGEGADAGRRARLVRETLRLERCKDDEVLAEPLYGCWEGNMGHSVQRKPIDICVHRGEEKVVIGNAGVVRVLEMGPAVKRLSPGQVGVVFSSSVVDRFGYPEKMLGYDAPGTMGCLAKRIKIREAELVSVPNPTRFSLPQWAAFSVRFITAWANWRIAFGTFRLMLDREECPVPQVWGWGGGTTLAELDLARRNGCQAVMLSGHDRHLATIEAAGVTGVDRRPFGDLTFDEARFGGDLGYRRAYTKAETAFLAEVQRRTEGSGVHVFVDYIGTPLLRPTLKALAREGVVTTAGWKEGMTISFLRASECISRHQHIHTHYARYPEGIAAVEYGEKTGWMPTIDDAICPFDEIPALAERYDAGQTGVYPVFAVNPV